MTTFASWLRFNVVGLFGMGVQLIALAILKGWVGLTVRTATVLAVEISVLHNFVWHERWTWKHRSLNIRGAAGRLLRFNFSNGLISILGNLGIMELLAVRFHFNYMLSNVAAIGACAILNFLVADKLVFKRFPS